MAGPIPASSNERIARITQAGVTQFIYNLERLGYDRFEVHRRVMARYNVTERTAQSAIERARRAREDANRAMNAEGGRALRAGEMRRADPGCIGYQYMTNVAYSDSSGVVRHVAYTVRNQTSMRAEDVLTRAAQDAAAYVVGLASRDSEGYPIDGGATVIDVQILGAERVCL